MFHVGRRLRSLLWVSLSAIALVAVAIGFAFLVRYFLNDRPIVLPRPRGPHPVGRVLADWKDTRRNRELMVFIWYPAVDGASGPRCEYIPGEWGKLEAKNTLPIPAKRLEQIEVSSIRDAQPASGPMPVLILLPGMGRIPAHYTTIAEDLASYGFLVAGVTPTGSARPAVIFSDGHRVTGDDEPRLNDRAAAEQLVKTWAGDASFVLDRLARDSRFIARPDGVGIFGHSFGGNVALHALAMDARFTRAANLDGSLFGDPLTMTGKPMMILCGEVIDDEWKPPCASGAATCAAFPKAEHMDFSDAAVYPSRFPIPKRMLLLGNVDGPEFLRGVSDRLRRFFGGARLQ